MVRDSRLSLCLHPSMIPDFLKDDEPLAHELNQSNIRDSRNGSIL